jgi:hypothetical protein
VLLLLLPVLALFCPSLVDPLLAAVVVVLATAVIVPRGADDHTDNKVVNWLKREAASSLFSVQLVAISSSDHHYTVAGQLKQTKE